MARHDTCELAIRLGRQAEAVCRHYLSNGRREGRYWLVGDVRNTKGRSMFVRLVGPETGKGAAGKFTDAATGEHGDLLDVIREALGLVDFKDVTEEARAFLRLPRPETEPDRHLSQATMPGSPQAARRLLAMSQPIQGTLAATYLHGRGITNLCGTASLRFHPRCYHRPDEHSRTQIWPAMVAAVTNLDGHVTGAHRTYLAPSGLDPSGCSQARLGKAPIKTPRRAMGQLLGHGIRFGAASDVLAAGEGIETVLSARLGIGPMPMLAATSAAHLAAILFPATLRRLYVLRDRDAAGDHARDRLLERASGAGIETVVLSPRLEDFNEDLRRYGPDALATLMRPQLIREDASRFTALAA